MINIFKRSFYKNGYLLIIAAWLYTISFIFSNYWFYSSSPLQVKSRIESYLKKGEQRFEDFTKDSFVINEISNSGHKPQKAQSYFEDDIGLFVYSYNSDGSLSPVFWNNNKVLPDQKDLYKRDGKYLAVHENGYFEFIKKSFSYHNKSFVACGIVPIYWKYFINNQYLQQRFGAIKNIEKRYDIATEKATIYIYSGDAKPLLGLVEKRGSFDEPGSISLVLRLLAVLFLLIFINVFSFELVKEKGWVKGFSFLAVSLLLMRFLSYHLPFPFKFRDLPLFDPSVYASNNLHPSLGDLLINIILLFWLISFVKFAAVNNFKAYTVINGKKAWWVTGILSVILIILSFCSASVIRSLIKDSKISFDVTNFFSLNVFSIISFIILCFIILSFFHVSHIVLLFIYKSVDVPVYWRYVMVTVLGMIYLSLQLNNPSTTSNIIVLIWLLAYLVIMEFRRDDIFIPIL
ncbi:MAG TPA: hypothetical protein VF623_10650, partial [Segetibacter sp.]